MRISVQSDIDTITLLGMPLRPWGVWGIAKQGIDGWFGAVAPRETTTAIPQMDGDYMPSRLTAGKRVVTIRGVIKGLSSVDAAMARDRINDLMGRDLLLTVEDSSGPRHARCFMSTDPEPLMIFTERGFTFTLILTCPDPLKYGTPISFMASGGVLRVQNAGRVASWPGVHVQGHVTTLSLVLGSDVVSWRGDATSLDLDFRDMLPSSGNVQIGNAFRIPPGENVVAVSVDSGAPVSMTVTPAWR